MHTESSTVMPAAAHMPSFACSKDNAVVFDINSIKLLCFLVLYVMQCEFEHHVFGFFLFGLRLRLVNCEIRQCALYH